MGLARLTAAPRPGCSPLPPGPHCRKWTPRLTPALLGAVAQPVPPPPQGGTSQAFITGRGERSRPFALRAWRRVRGRARTGRLGGGEGGQGGGGGRACGARRPCHLAGPHPSGSGGVRRASPSPAPLGPDHWGGGGDENGRPKCRAQGGAWPRRTWRLTPCPRRAAMAAGTGTGRPRPAGPLRWGCRDGK